MPCSPCMVMFKKTKTSDAKSCDRPPCMAHNSGFTVMMSISHDRQWFLLGVRVMNAAQYAYIYMCKSGEVDRV